MHRDAPGGASTASLGWPRCSPLGHPSMNTMSSSPRSRCAKAWYSFHSRSQTALAALQLSAQRPLWLVKATSMSRIDRPRAYILTACCIGLRHNGIDFLEDRAFVELLETTKGVLASLVVRADQQ